MEHHTNRPQAGRLFPLDAGQDQAGSARTMSPPQRARLATHVLAGCQSARQAAREHHVSRKFVARQTAKAQNALEQAFAPPEPTASEVLFHLPVTKSWIEQTVLGLSLTGRASERGIVQFFHDHFDYSLSVGRVHSILKRAARAACEQNTAVPLQSVDVAALDEIFQARQPVLVGADAASTYCFLLSAEEHRDADTWGVRLLELAQRGLSPSSSIADFAGGLRAGVAQAWPDHPCRGDVFHALYELGKVVRVLENQAYRAIELHGVLLRRQDRHEWRHGRADRSLAARIRNARRDEQQAVALADEVKLLADWLRRDILSIAGPGHADRLALFDFAVAELQPRLASGSLAKVVGLLKNHRDELLAFAAQLDLDLAALAREHQVDPALLRDLLEHQAADPRQAGYWQREAQLHRHAGGRLYPLRQAVAQLARRTTRASSVIENLNSRLRGYFTLRRQLGAEALALLQFYLNHRRFPRSVRPERRGRSPRELLSGQTHPCWLALLGYQPFERN